LHNDTARGLIAAGLQDKFSGIREKSLGLLGDSSLLSFCLPWVVGIADGDSNTLIRAKAINILAGLKDTSFMSVFVKALGSASYVVQSAALEAISRVDPAMAVRCAKRLEKDNLGSLTKGIVRLYSTAGGESEWAFVYNRFLNGTVREKVQLIDDLTTMICRIEDPVLAGRGIELLKETAVKYRKKGAGKYVQGLLKRVEEARSAVGDQVSAEACRVAIDGIDKSGGD
jgi:aminopeptidase N